MPEQELDLLQFTTGEMTQAGAAAAEVVGGQVCDSRTSGRALHNVPYRLRRNVFAPYGPGSADARKMNPVVIAAAFVQ